MFFIALVPNTAIFPEAHLKAPPVFFIRNGWFLRPRTIIVKRRLLSVFILPQRGERANGHLWHQAGGFYCYVWFEIVVVLLLLSLLF